MSFNLHLIWTFFKKPEDRIQRKGFDFLSPPLRHQAKLAQAVKVARAGVGGKDFWWVFRVVRWKEKILTLEEG